MRRSLAVILVSLALGFSIGSVATLALCNNEFISIRSEIEQLKRMAETTLVKGTTGENRLADADRKLLVAEIGDEMGLLPLNMMRERKDSLVELHSYTDQGEMIYGTAGYLGNGYFITVKHGVVALDQKSKKIVSVKVTYKDRQLRASVIDMGDAVAQVQSGDWAILKIKEEVDIPPLKINMGFGFEFAEPIFRVGNDYDKGMVVSTGYVGQRTSNRLITCLTDGHPGVSGGGVFNRQGEFVGIPIGRMTSDFRFSFILPLREEMFRKTKLLPN